MDKFNLIYILFPPKKDYHEILDPYKEHFLYLIPLINIPRIPSKNIASEYHDGESSQDNPDRNFNQSTSLDSKCGRKIKFSLFIITRLFRCLLIAERKKAISAALIAPFTTPIVTIQASFYEIRATTSSPPVYMEIECAYRSSVHLPSTPAPDTV